MYHPSRSLKQLAACRAELLAESRSIRSEMKRNAAALLPVLSKIETGVKIGRTLKIAGTIASRARDICSVFTGNGV